MQNAEQIERIRQRAYALYLNRREQGQEDVEGAALSDWLRAEKELADTVRTSRPRSTPSEAGAAQQVYGGDVMSSGPEPEAPDPASLEDVAPGVNSPRGINAEGSNRSAAKAENNHRRH